MLIDCHVHMFSEDELREAGEAPIVAMQRFGRDSAPVRRIEQTIAEMSEAGIDKGVLLPIPTPQLDVRRNNDEIASWVIELGVGVTSGAVEMAGTVEAARRKIEPSSESACGIPWRSTSTG